jgi:hypothetical protein
MERKKKRRNIDLVNIEVVYYVVVISWARMFIMAKTRCHFRSQSLAKSKHLTNSRIKYSRQY